MAMPSFFRGRNDYDESNSGPHAWIASALMDLVLSPAGGPGVSYS